VRRKKRGCYVVMSDKGETAGRPWLDLHLAKMEIEIARELYPERNWEVVFCVEVRVKKESKV